MGFEEIAGVARNQGGVVSVRQAIAVGVPRSTLDDAVRRWGMHRPHRGVVALPGADLHSDIGRLWVALCAVGSPAWASGSTAVALQLGDRLPHVVDIAVPTARRPTAPPSVRVRRLRLGSDDVGRAGGSPVVRLDRALREVAALEPYDELVGLVAAAVQRRRTTLARLRATTGGRAPGGVLLRSAIDDLAGTEAESALAHRVAHLLACNAIMTDAEVPVDLPGGRTVRLDLVAVGTRIAIEVDGHAVHGRRRAAAQDRARSNAIILAGWTLLRVDWLRLTEDPDGFVDEVRHAMRSAA